MSELARSLTPTGFVSSSTSSACSVASMLHRLRCRLSAAQAVFPRMRSASKSSTAGQPIVLPNGATIHIQQHFFEDPVQQPRSPVQGRADRTGLKSWPTALPLLDFVTMRYQGKHMRVLELGSGCGTLGLGFAAMVPDAQVLLTDPDLPTNFDEDAHESSSTLEWLRGNVALNTDALGERVHATALLWGHAGHAEHIIRDARWSTGFDLIVGSDLLYNPDVYADLLSTLHTFSSVNSCPVVLGYPARINEERFLRSAETLYDIETRTLPLNGASASVLTPRTAA